MSLLSSTKILLLFLTMDQLNLQTYHIDSHIEESDIDIKVESIETYTIPDHFRLSYHIHIMKHGILILDIPPLSNINLELNKNIPEENEIADRMIKEFKDRVCL